MAPVSVSVASGRGMPISARPVELVERKGKGHPDTICDRAAEEASIAVSKYYLEEYGRILHHNLDKCVLIGGQAKAWFGGGEVLEPMYLLLVGRATTRVIGDEGLRDLPIGSVTLKAIREWMREDFRFLDLDSHIVIDYKIKPGSADLVSVFNSGSDIPLANDTSFGVAFAPYTVTERLVLETEKLLNSREFKRKLPEVGEDVKVMGLRVQNKISLTVAAAMISSLVPDKSHYMSVIEEVKNKILDIAAKITDLEVSVAVNTADDYERGRFYLTVTGLSAESGDDGQVGRGNRVSGLITPFRPMSLEAAAGKNPVSHVGKIYNIAAQIIADTLVKEIGNVEEAYCYILSRIGRPITQPQLLHIEFYGGASEDYVKRYVEPVAEDVLSRLPKMWNDFLDRKFTLF